jgi:hypothetical protein
MKAPSRRRYLVTPGEASTSAIRISAALTVTLTSRPSKFIKR